jgi:Fe-Mn family superoxide dismutase
MLGCYEIRLEGDIIELLGQGILRAATTRRSHIIRRSVMTIEVRPLLFKPHRLSGLSDKLLVSHYENNYGGALRRLNAIQAQLAAVEWPTAPVFEINGVKREELIAAGSVILHEIYFDALGGEGGDPVAAHGLAEVLERDFGSLLAWHAEFTSMAKAQAGGSGWALLVWSERLGRLVNQWAGDHAHGLAGSAPILALDMYEHAYHMDFGAKAAAYVDAVMANLHWERIEARYRRARHDGAEDAALFAPAGAPLQEEMVITAEALRAACDRNPPVLLDVCLEDDLARRSDMLSGATLRAPGAIDRWVSTLPRDKPIAVYCIYGFQVSGNTVAELRRRGYDARAVKGGIAAWHAIGGRTVPLDRSTYHA